MLGYLFKKSLSSKHTRLNYLNARLLCIIYRDTVTEAASATREKRLIETKPQTTHFTAAASGDSPPPPPLKVGVRRTHTFTSSDKRRNTVMSAGGRGGVDGVHAANADLSADASKALVRAPNMDNIVG